MIRQTKTAATGPNPESDKREAILQAALELFSERGYHGTAVPLVAERAGVAIGTIYRYFRDKEALVNAVFQEWKARIGAHLFRGFSPDGDVREQFHVLWTNMVAFAMENPEAVMFLEAHFHAPYLDEKSRALEASIREPMNELIRQISERGVTKDMPPELLLAVTLGIGTGVLKEVWSGRLQLNAEIVSQAESCCWDAIRRI